MTSKPQSSRNYAQRSNSSTSYTRCNRRQNNIKSRNETIPIIADPPLKFFGPKDLPHHGPHCQFVFPPTKDGLAIYEYPNPFFKYIGEWKDGKKHGKGKLFIGQDSYYEGDFDQGEISGNGERFFANGNHYIGTFDKGEFNGKGTFTDAVTGEVYVGDFLDNRRHGDGVLTYSDGTKYVGKFINHKRDGEGEYTDSEGNHYKGEWKANRIEGKGKMEYANGDVYDGYFIDGKRSGKGTMKWGATGLIITGEWSNDICNYKPESITVSDLPPITPGTTLNNIVISIVGGDGESGRRLKVRIEYGKIDPNASLKKTAKAKKQEPVEHVPKYLILNPETGDAFLELEVQNGSAIVPPISIPIDIEQSTYSMIVDDLSIDNPLPQITVDFQFVASPAAVVTEKASAKGKVQRKNATSRASDRKTITRK